MLESGEFKQTREILRDETKGQPMHCCLGVACELYSVECGGFWDTTNFFIADYFQGDIPDASGGFLPKAVMKWLGLTTFQANHLVHLNDTGSDFHVIAQVLRGWIGDV